MDNNGNYRWHINLKTGMPGKCYADPSNPRSTGCRFNISEDLHYNNAEEALNGYAEIMHDKGFDEFHTESSETPLKPYNPEDRYANLLDDEMFNSVLTKDENGNDVFDVNAMTDEQLIAMFGDDSIYFSETLFQKRLQEDEAARQSKEEEQVEKVDNTEATYNAGYAAGYNAASGITNYPTYDYDLGYPTADDPFFDPYADFDDDYEYKTIDSSLIMNSGRFQNVDMLPTRSEVASAKLSLNRLKVQANFPDDYYDREALFGAGFQDGVMSQIEQRDIRSGIFSDGMNGNPRVRGGSYKDPYTGEVFEIDPSIGSLTNIDHIVPLHEVIRSQDVDHPLSADERIMIANDPDNLIVVSEHINKEKGDRNPGKWMPPDLNARGRYAIAYIKVKHRYNLTVDKRELEVLNHTLDDCVAVVG